MQKSLNNNIIMTAMRLKLLFSLCLVSTAFLPHPFPAPLGPKGDGFILVVVVKGAFWTVVTAWSNFLEE